MKTGKPQLEQNHQPEDERLLNVCRMLQKKSVQHKKNVQIR